MPRILILYTELAEYMLHVLAELRKQTALAVVHWPVNPEAPFVLPTWAELHEKSQFNTATLLEFSDSFQPELVLISGWVDKDYLKVCKHLFGQSKIVVCMDNQWEGTWRQQLARLLFPFRYAKHFHAAWVSGPRQAKFARNLGFTQIEEGFYCANTTYFGQFADRSLTHFSNPAKVLLYVGRYVRHKGIFELWDAFSRLHKQYTDWQLWCIGTGAEWDNRVQHPAIKHLGFLQPSEMASILPQVHAYVLPSTFEPWAVSVHEMAAAGLPMLLSNRVGASDVFLVQGENGFLFDPESRFGLFDGLESLFRQSPEALYQMSTKSVALSLKISPSSWLNTLAVLAER